MPWSEKQVRVFKAIEHGWKPSAPGLRKLTPEQAGKMASEGVRTTDDAATALSKRMKGR
jgi:hypothetical protein